MSCHRKSNPGLNPGSVPSSNPGSNPGSVPSSNPGSNPGSDPGFILSLSPTPATSILKLPFVQQRKSRCHSRCVRSVIVISA